MSNELIDDMTKSSKITTTLNAIREHSPCESGWRKLLKHLGKTEAAKADNVIDESRPQHLWNEATYHCAAARQQSAAKADNQQGDERLTKEQWADAILAEFKTEGNRTKIDEWAAAYAMLFKQLSDLIKHQPTAPDMGTSGQKPSADTSAEVATREDANLEAPATAPDKDK